MEQRSRRAVWDGHAAGYGRQERLERRAIDAAVRLVDAKPDDVLVDLATGSGLLLRSLAAAGSCPHRAIGVDRSPGMLAHVDALPDGWTTIEADARRVPLGDRTATIVTIAYLLHLLDAGARAAVLAEARRLLEPGGALVVVTVWADEKPGSRVIGAALDLMARARPAAWGGLRTLDPTTDLVAAGFVPERRVQMPRGGYPSLVIRARPSPGPS